MNLLTRSSKFFLITWLCFFTLIGFKTLSGFVLCIGEDGHVALEFSVNDKCGDAAKSPRAGVTTMNSAVEDHCGECLDLPLISETSRVSKNGAPSVSNIGLYPSVSTCLIFLNVPGDQTRHPLPSPPILLELASLRTIRLLV